MPFAPVQGITLVPQFRARRSLASLSPGAFVKGRLVGNAKCGSSWLSIDPLFELAWTLYYLPCYTLVTITTLLLTADFDSSHSAAIRCNSGESTFIWLPDAGTQVSSHIAGVGPYPCTNPNFC